MYKKLAKNQIKIDFYTYIILIAHVHCLLLLQGCHVLTLEKQKMTHKKQKTTEALSSKSRKKAESFFLIANYHLNFVSM
jgi:hypothetical protein